MADRIALTDDEEKIISLWSSVFGDSAEDIKFFLQECVHKLCLGYFIDDDLVSMLFMVDCYYCGKKGAYLYAVCTNSNFRGRGYVSKLIDKAKKSDNYFLWLIPANDSLFNFYERFGFETKLYSDKKFQNSVTFKENDEIYEYLYSGSDYKYPAGMIYSEHKLPNGSTGLKIKE